MVDTHSYRLSPFGPALQFGGGSWMISESSFWIRLPLMLSSLDIFGCSLATSFWLLLPSAFSALPLVTFLAGVLPFDEVAWLAECGCEVDCEFVESSPDVEPFSLIRLFFSRSRRSSFILSVGWCGVMSGGVGGSWLDCSIGRIGWKTKSNLKPVWWIELRMN